MKSANIMFLFISFILTEQSVAQTDSIYERYTNKFRLESFSIIPTYVPIKSDSGKDVFNWNGTFSYRKHLLQIGHLEIAFDSDINRNNTASTKNTYNLFHVDYGKATIFTPRFRMHNTIGLGQIRIKRTLAGTILQNDKSINLRLGHVTFFDVNKKIAIGASAGMNLNSLKIIPEAGITLAYKPLTSLESQLRQDKRVLLAKQKDSLYAVKDSITNKNKLKFHALQFGIGYSNTRYTASTVERYVETDESDSFGASYLEFATTVRYNKQLLSVVFQGSTRLGILESPANFSDISLLYGRMFQSDKRTEIELYTGISYFKINNIGDRQEQSESAISWPIKTNFVFSSGRNRYGFTLQSNINKLAINYIAGFQYSKRF